MKHINFFIPNKKGAPPYLLVYQLPHEVTLIKVVLPNNTKSSIYSNRGEDITSKS